ncbi:MAG: ribonuclease Y [Chlamydiales bacterium]
MKFENLFTILLSFGIGIFLSWAFYRLKKNSFLKLAKEIVNRAEMEVQLKRKDAELNLEKELKQKLREHEISCEREKKKITIEKERLKLREDKLEERFFLLEKKLNDFEKKDTAVQLAREKLEEQKAQLNEEKNSLSLEWERLAGISMNEAKLELFQRAKIQIEEETARFIKKIIAENELQSKKISQEILSTCLNRTASSAISEISVTTISLPNESMKSRIIGREGRNIRCLEKETGVSFLIDDTPGAVVLSSFDPIKKEIARLSLLKLISDGRIHPTRIEEVVAETSNQIQKDLSHYGREAAEKLKIFDLHPEIHQILGKLKFCFNLGQNVLDHSIEVANLMSLMAAELGLNVHLAKRIGLLHDIGKGVSGNFDKSHALIGKDIALKYGESDQVANGIACHHEETEPTTPESWLCGAANTLSASRPGARSESLESYICRIHDLEKIAMQFPSVAKAYTLQAGREIRIFTIPNAITDDEAVLLARDITKKIEQTLSFPGKIKVTVIRETRAISYAI